MEITVTHIIKGILSFMIFAFIGCKSQTEHVNANIVKNPNNSSSFKLSDLMSGKWQLEDDSEHTMLVTNDSLYNFYKDEEIRRSLMVIDSITISDKYLVADTAYDFTKDKPDYGLKVRLLENSGNDSSEFLLIYVDSKSLELGTHNGSHLFKRIK